MAQSTERRLFLRPSFDQGAGQIRLVEIDADLQALLAAPGQSNQEATALDGDPSPRRPKRGRGVLIKGDATQALLCTHDRTYQIRRAEFSNSLLVVEGRRIVEKAPFLFETHKTRGHVEVALQLLQDNYLVEDEIEGRSPPPAPEKLVTLDAIRRIAPADVKSLTAFLRRKGAIVQGPFVRLMHPKLVQSYLEAIMHLLEARVRMLEDGIDVRDVVTALGSSLDPVCLESCLRQHGDIKVTSAAPTDEAPEATEPSSSWWTPKLPLVVATLSKPILEREESWRVDSFFTELSSKYFLLSGLNPTHLRGHATVVGPNLVVFEMESLPYEPVARLHAMFHLKPRWEMDDFEAYFGALEMGGNDLIAFIGKHCRVHKDHKGIGVPTTYSLA